MKPKTCSETIFFLLFMQVRMQVTAMSLIRRTEPLPVQSAADTD